MKEESWPRGIVLLATKLFSIVITNTVLPSPSPFSPLQLPVVDDKPRNRCGGRKIVIRPEAENVSKTGGGEGEGGEFDRSEHQQVRKIL